MKRQQRSSGSIGLALPQLDLRMILFERNTLKYRRDFEPSQGANGPVRF